jgi:hypothetical protein
MSKVVPIPSSNSASRAAATPRAEKIAEAIKLLADDLSPEEQDWVLNKITEELRPIATPKAGDVLGALVRLLPKRRDGQQWTAQDLKQEIDQQGVEATTKEVHNAIGYLRRIGKVRRVAYGRYVVDGAELRTLEDFGDSSSHNEFEGR